MKIKVAINGFGRIGRTILRAHYENKKKHDLTIVAINGSGNAADNAHLLKYDSTHGKFNEDGSGIWAGYEPADQNEEKVIGVKCSNCALYAGGNVCEIIAMEVEPEGKCRFAVIPNGIVKKKK